MSKKVKTSPVHLIYWCKTSVIDKIVSERRGITFDDDLAKKLDQTARHYLVIDKKGQCAIVNGPEFEKYFDNQEAPHKEQTPEVMKAIDGFIKRVHGV